MSPTTIREVPCNACQASACGGALFAWLHLSGVLGELGKALRPPLSCMNHAGVLEGKVPDRPGHERAHPHVGLLAHIPHPGGKAAPGADAVPDSLQGLLPVQALRPPPGVAQLAGALHCARTVCQGRQGALCVPLPGAYWRREQQIYLWFMWPSIPESKACNPGSLV